MGAVIVAIALVIGAGARPAAARSIGEVVDDTRITAEVMAKLTAESPSNFVKIGVKSDQGIVTLSGTVDTPEKRSTAATIAAGVNGVKGLVNNIQVAGAAAPAPMPPQPRSGVEATGRVTAVDPAAGTITLSDGRVLLVTGHTLVYQPTKVESLKPGDEVFVRDAAAATVSTPGARTGTVSRVDTTRNELILADGTVVRVPQSATLRRGSERLSLAQIPSGAEVVVQIAPVPAASPATTGTSTPPATTTPPVNAAALDAADVNVVWPPSATTR